MRYMKRWRTFNLSKRSNTKRFLHNVVGDLKLALGLAVFAI